MKECAIEDCYSGQHGKGFCSKHYQRLKRNGDAYAKVAPNGGRFVKGLEPWNKGLKGIHMSPNTEFKRGQVANELHPLWKGERPGYFAVHIWVSRHYGKPQECEHCYDTDAKRYEWANISGDYNRNRSDWRRLCKQCHNIFDAVGLKSRETRTC